MTIEHVLYSQMFSLLINYVLLPFFVSAIGSAVVAKEFRFTVPIEHEIIVLAFVRLF